MSTLYEPRSEKLIELQRLVARLLRAQWLHSSCNGVIMPLCLYYRSDNRPYLHVYLVSVSLYMEAVLLSHQVVRAGRTVRATISIQANIAICSAARADYRRSQHFRAVLNSVPATTDSTPIAGSRLLVTAIPK